MKHDDILQFYGYLNRFALSKCNTQADAEDLVEDTMYEALAYLHDGGVILYPKTWLTNTLLHIYNSNLRKKYRSPVIVCIDDIMDIADDNDNHDSLQSDEAAQIRREINFLAYTTREVLIRYYFAKSSVMDIARQLNIPEGTVKSRLSTGRNQIRKGLNKMEIKENYLPSKLHVSNSGSCGPKNEPMSLVEGDLIAQNLLILAYDKPLYISELSRMIGIPVAYIEPIVKKLADGELMMKTEGDKYYTDFIIYKPEDSLDRFDAQLNFVHERFEIIWSIMSEIIQKIDALEFSKSLNGHQLKKLERYAIMRALQNFQLRGIGDANWNSAPNRKDGGRWIAMGNMIPAGYDERKRNSANNYTVSGGHRTSGGECDYLGAKYLQFCEFDTPLWDSPCRFYVCGFVAYFKEIRNMLWCIQKGLPIEESGITNTMIESIPGLEKVGLLSSESGKLAVDIPVMNRSVYKEVVAITEFAFDRLINEIGADYKAYLKGNMIRIPQHIKSIIESYRYSPATCYIVMAAVREAYNKGLHLHDVDYCCPPVVLVYEE